MASLQRLPGFAREAGAQASAQRSHRPPAAREKCHRLGLRAAKLRSCAHRGVDLGMTKTKFSKGVEEDVGAAEFLEKRRAALERFVTRVAQHPSLVQASLAGSPLLWFLFSTEENGQRYSDVMTADFFYYVLFFSTARLSQKDSLVQYNLHACLRRRFQDSFVHTAPGATTRRDLSC